MQSRNAYVGLRARAFFIFKSGVLRTNNEVSCIEVQDCVVSARVTVTAPFAYRAEN